MQDFLFPSSSPVDFEPKEAHLAIDKILATKAERAYVTHGGVWEDMKLGASQMHYGIQQYSLIMQDLIAKIKDAERRNIPLDEDVLHNHALAKMRQFFEEELQKHGLKHEEPAIWDLLNTDIELNAQGLVVAAHNFKDSSNFWKAPWILSINKTLWFTFFSCSSQVHSLESQQLIGLFIETKLISFSQM